MKTHSLIKKNLLVMFKPRNYIYVYLFYSIQILEPLGFFSNVQMKILL